ncbi:MAG: pyridoxal phosphate-dependent aminotransferase [Myxococcales bacterium]|jgi:N-succinyldiaminopimelate aminotransferase
MPRFPSLAGSADGLSDRVFGQRAPGVKPADHVYPLNVGDTYRQPPEVARVEQLRAGEHPRLYNYSPVQGEPALLDAIVDKVERRSGVELQRDHLQVMNGATSGLGVVCTALLDPGDEVLLPSPYWPLIRGIVRFRGAVPVEVPLLTRLDEPGFDPVAALEAAITPRTAALYLNSPHNPTGRVLPDALLSGIADLAARHDLWVICDEVYEDLWYGPSPPPSPWARRDLRERAVASHSVSKAYGLAAARVGYTHGPESAMEAVRGVQTFFTYCAPRPMQLGAARALSEGDEWLADARRDYARAAAAACEALELPRPEGGTFLFFPAAPYLRRSESTADLLNRCAAGGVMLTPGRSSGRDYDDWLRLCFTSVPQVELEAALDRLLKVLRKS